MPVIEKQPKWARKFSELVESCWEYHGPAVKVTFKWAWDTDERCWYILAAPCWQEVLGGEDDGKKVWTGFVFHTDAFTSANGIFIDKQGASSVCHACSAVPRLMFAGKFRTHNISLQIWLHPADGPAVEIIDTLNQEIKDKENTDDDDGDASQQDHAGDEGSQPGERHSPGLPGETPGD